MRPVTTYSDGELERLLIDVESDLVERKEVFQGEVTNAVREAVCAFANDLPDHRRGGVVFIGARNDGTSTDLVVSDELLLQLSDIKTDGNIVPPLTLTVAKRSLAGAEMAVITVEPADSPPVRFKGRIHIRIGPRRGIAADEQVVDGPVSELRRRIDEKLTAHNRVAVEFTSGPVERRTQPYPFAALQQLVRNAVLHRAYETTNAPIHVYWYDDRIEIISPGGPYGRVTPETFAQPGEVDYRNPNLAEALRVLGFVQRFGVGIAIARRELERNGNPPPSFELGASSVLVRVGVHL